MTLGEKLKLLRTERGWTQPELANKIGATRQRVCNYEHDIYIPPLEILKNIAKVFSVSLDYLILDEKDTSTLNDKQLLECFQVADRFPPKRKKLIKDLIMDLSSKQ